MRTLLTTLFFAISLRAAESNDVYPAGKDDKTLNRIPGLVATSSGTLLAYCESRLDRSDWGSIELVLRRSSDGGRTWSPRQLIGKLPGDVTRNPASVAKKLGKPGQFAQNNPVMIVDGETVHLIYCVEYARVFHRRSDDDGRTWSDPVEITAAFEPLKKDYNWKVVATGPGHGIRLKNGRLLVACWLSLGTGGNAHHPSAVTTLVSDDAGKTWNGGSIAVPSSAEVIDPNETAAAELSDGRVLLNVRHIGKSHRRVQVTSLDGTSNWSKPAFADDLVEPICFGSLLAYDEHTLLFCNPVNMLVGGKEAAPGKSRDRKNLTLHVSTDDGKTWPKAITLDEGKAAYSDLARGKDGTLFVLYERNNSAALTFLSLKPESFR